MNINAASLDEFLACEPADPQSSFYLDTENCIKLARKYEGGQDQVIWGARGNGRSTLLNCVKEKLKSRGFIVSMLDFKNVRTSSFSEFVVDNLRQELSEHFSQITWNGPCEDCLQLLTGEGVKLAFLFDNIDYCIQEEYELERQKFFSAIRSVQDSQKNDGRVRFAFVAQRNIPELERLLRLHSLGSPLTTCNSFHVAAGYSSKEVKTFAADSATLLKSRAIEDPSGLHELTAGNPLLVQKVIGKFSTNAEDSPILQTVIEQIKDTNHLFRVFEDPNMRAALMSILNGNSLTRYDDCAVELRCSGWLGEDFDFLTPALKQVMQEELGKANHTSSVVKVSPESTSIAERFSAEVDQLSDAHRRDLLMVLAAINSEQKGYSLKKIGVLVVYARDKRNIQEGMNFFRDHESLILQLPREQNASKPNLRDLLVVFNSKKKNEVNSFFADVIDIIKGKYGQEWTNAEKIVNEARQSRCGSEVAKNSNQNSSKTLRVDAPSSDSRKRLSRIECPVKWTREINGSIPSETEFKKLRELFPSVVTQDRETMGPVLKKLLCLKGMRPKSLLIEGATGTGKQVIAEAVHQIVDGRRDRFESVNAGALEENLVGSELFGHVKGAFTDAFTDRDGKFELAKGGTLFLDECNSVSEAVQKKLLDVLQERKFKRIGGSKTNPVDVFLIVGANESMSDLVSRKVIRKDFYYRVEMFMVTLPPLSQRKRDIEILALEFCKACRREYGEDESILLTDHALKKLENWDWPGNVRELSNCVERAVINSGGKQISPDLISFSKAGQGSFT